MFFEKEQTEPIENCKYPKVLIVTNSSMNSDSQTAITLRGIWASWPKECIMQFVFGKKNDFGDDERINYYVPDSRQPLSYLANKSFARTINKNMKVKNPNVETVDKNIPLKVRLRQYAYSLVDRSPIYLHKEDYDAISSYNPDVIYTLGSNVTLLKVSISIARYTNRPIIMHFMDNWPETIQWGDNRLLTGYDKTLKRWLNKAYSFSNCALTISEQMAVDYEKKTGLRHFPIMNVVNLDEWHCEKKSMGECLNFVYAGGLHLGRDETLLGIYQELGKIGKSLNKQCKLNIYSNSANAEGITERITDDTLVIHGAVTHNLLRDVYKDADVLIIPEALTNRLTTELFAKYSISTKTAEYLATSKPILYVGNANRALYSYLRDNDAAMVVDDLRSIGAIIHENIERFDEISKNAFELAKKNHNKCEINNKLLTALNYRKD